MGRNLEDASEGSTTPSATRIQETLPCSIDAFSCMTTFHSSATATRATCALTELRTRTRTPHRTTRKRNVSRMTPTTQSTEREDGVFRHRFTRLHVAVLGSLKPMLSDFLDLLLDRGERFRSCPRSSVAKMWTARNTIHLTFKAMRQKHRTTWNIAAHSCEVPLHMLLHKHTDPQKKKKNRIWKYNALVEFRENILPNIDSRHTQPKAFNTPSKYLGWTLLYKWDTTPIWTAKKKNELIRSKITSLKKNLLYRTLHFIEHLEIFKNILKSPKKKNWKMFCASWHANNNASDFSGLTTPVEKEITAFYTCPKKPTRERERDYYTRSWQHWVSRFCTVITQRKRHHS